MQKASGIFLFAIAVILGSCATPSQPTGGPSDTSGPEIVFTTPESGTVNFDDDQITIEFSDYVDRPSFESAFRIEPDLGIRYNLNWGRRSVRVRFDSELPENTTIIFNIGTELTDTRRNRMASPYQLALSTGPEIDTGSITASVRDAETGRPKAGARVLLYRSPYDLTQKANYSVETDTSGRASFNHLSEGTYRGFWVDDRNRNQIWEPPREVAQPFPIDTLILDKGGEASFGTVYVTREDTVAPELLAVGLLSASRMRLRFSENIQLSDTAAINVFTEDGELYSEAIPLYVDETEPNILFAQSLTDFQDEESYSIELKGIADASGNVAYPAIETFPGSDAEETMPLTYIDHLTQLGVYADQPLVFQYSKLIDDEVVIDSLKVVEGSDLFEQWPQVRIENNNLLVAPDSVWQAGQSYEIRIWDPASAGFQNIEPVIWHEGELGELEIIIEDARPGEAPHRYSLHDNDGKLFRAGSFRDSVTVSQLPPQSYKLTVFEDVNGSGYWNPGRVQPYRAPEPYFIQRSIPVQSNMTGQVFVNFGHDTTNP